MEDFEKTRLDHIHMIETQLDHAKREMQKYKAAADLWTPIIAGEMDEANQRVKVSLTFGGKSLSATMSYDYLLGMDETSAISSTVDVLANSIIADRLRSLITPEVQRLIQGVTVASKAGKW